ncbi:aspartate--tRNA ligase [Candidatus Falkowbacteria bacterium CG_4_9_14_3_um_filter_36_9]|nr:MAG: aspartate--tRNA ligase [Candidatus Falkowbacteria bacterium CG02_land_8_20_14_3_00_36_14]PIX12502.1 MAG: aspartate--tRNA ligase [Candidatus Falkowbacteria bacterium CG_4_8_14_3_um_filter_36_11]PJA10873.1 MAG: aspartate--tRNA ligase [Candidatus Falkowbacteria bacterium CG_4_10_14_0_2_um_filter_36_22]PJB20815.1 MAG: aspartate--tRNA ligase [Candidatus Falkowbacteria bacterium CG_4_9_14_3_um_filter_36_9]
MLRTHTCGELNKNNIGQKVTLNGWVHRRRDHGGIIFIDLRDRYGLTQIKFDPAVSKKAWQEADKLRSEWVIKASGDVIARPHDMINPRLKTGEVEVKINNLEILNRSATPPFAIDEIKADEANEALRLKYRFIDLRRPEIQTMLATKDKYIQHIRNYFQKHDFIEIQTPILASSSPEGARDFLVPSRLYPGKFYALPQAPQQFKQLLMVGGLDKYFQIAPCFRDEDPRMDRHYGEFYQLDMEMSFVSQEDILNIMEPLMIGLTNNFSNKKIVDLDKDGKFRRIPWREAMAKYGSDKPDLRFDLEIIPITEMVVNCGFSVFAQAIKNGGVVHALKVNNGAKFTRKEIDELTEIAKTKNAKGLAYIIVKKGKELQSPIVKFLGDKLSQKIIDKVKAKEGDIVFFGADEWRVVCSSLGAVRDKCGLKLGLKDNHKAAWCWIVDFPMYSYSEINPGKIDFNHNPFSMPQGGLKALNNKNPLEILAFQFDLVLNGFEVSSGAIRNHDPLIMYKAFAIAGYAKKEVDERFGGLIRAFKYGAPPHGGNAPGIDRILMVFNDLESIRDIYAFPKDGKGKDLMMDSPSEISEKQLNEIYIKIKKN